ncbi:hypothetical protein ABBQ32_012432 [Trebouxia sp. C0010 RCD-2024]
MGMCAGSEPGAAETAGSCKHAAELEPCRACCGLLKVKAGAVEAAGSCKHAGELESCCGLLGSFAHQKKQLQAQTPFFAI